MSFGKGKNREYLPHEMKLKNSFPEQKVQSIKPLKVNKKQKKHSKTDEKSTIKQKKNGMKKIYLLSKKVLL